MLQSDNLNEEPQLFLDSEIKHILRPYCSGEDIHNESYLDGRLVLEVTGKSIILSKVKPEIEKKLQNNPAIEEIRFVGGDIFYADISLETLVWKGKNIVVFTKVFKIEDNIRWNISGKNAPNTHPAGQNAGCSPSGEGIDGLTGMAGESGGNCVIVGDYCSGGHHLSIISNGGHGSEGQDGGDGNKGKNGSGIILEQFKTDWPAPAKTGKGRRAAFLQKFVTNIKKNSSIGNGDTESWARTENGIGLPPDNEVFLTAGIGYDDQMKFTFSYYDYNNAHALLLIKGTLGKMGQPGGEGGHGGEGGFPGKIEFYHSQPNKVGSTQIITDGVPGQPGKDGKIGKTGPPGENGCDVGLIDWSGWGTPAYFGGQTGSCLKVTYSDVKTKLSAWCPYYGKWAEISPSEVEITSSQAFNENSTRNNTKESTTAKVGATRKKGIQANSIQDQYASSFSSLADRELMTNLEKEAASFKTESLEALAMLGKQIEKESETIEVDLDVKVHRSVTRANRNARFSKSKFITEVSTQSMNTFSKLTSFPPQTSAVILNNYKLSILDSVRKEFSLEFNCPESSLLFSEIKLSPEMIAHYLEEISEESNKYEQFNYNHSSLGSLQEMLFKFDSSTCKKLADYLQKDQQNWIRLKNRGEETNFSNQQLFENCLESFISTIGGIPDNNLKYPQTGFYFEKHSQHTIELQNVFKTFKATFQEQGNGQKLFELWLESIFSKNKDLVLAFESKLKPRHTKSKSQPEANKLWDLYQQMSKLLKIGADSCDIITDTILWNEFISFISKNQTSPCFQELVAYLFEINLRVYVKSPETGKITLTQNWNVYANSVVHILLKCNKFSPLISNSDLLKFWRARSHQSSCYEEILTQIESFLDSGEVDKYFNDKQYLKFLNKSNSSFPPLLLQFDYDSDDAVLNQLIEFYPQEASSKKSSRKNYDKIHWE